MTIRRSAEDGSNRPTLPQQLRGAFTCDFHLASFPFDVIRHFFQHLHRL